MSAGEIPEFRPEHPIPASAVDRLCQLSDQLAAQMDHLPTTRAAVEANTTQMTSIASTMAAVRDQTAQVVAAVQANSTQQAIVMERFTSHMDALFTKLDAHFARLEELLTR